jgi:adenylosuccinate lyase
MNEVMLPTLRALIAKFSEMTEQYKDSPMMARTH